MASVRSSAAYRIAVAYAAIFAWIIVLLGAAVYFAADAEFRRDRDRGIAEELGRLGRYTKHSELLRELRLREMDGPKSGFAYGLFDREGKRIAGTLDIPPPRLGFEDLSLRDDAGKQLQTHVGSIDLTGGSRLVVAADSRANDRSARTILEIFSAAFLAVLVLSALGGLVLGWYLRNRLKPISDTANAIVTGDMEWRVPVGNHGDEFDAAAHALNLMLDRIAALMENLRQVSSDIAHDLRKPLMRLLVQTDRLGREGAEERVHELGDEMLALFAGILRIAEVEGGGLERSFSHIDLSALMGEVAESFEPALADGGHAIEWTIEPDVTVMGNRELLAQLATNLLDNARIHTPAGTLIKLGVAVSGDDAELSIDDNGPGVPEGDREKLPQRFFRAEASRTTPGNGLGLSLVAAAARAHGGTIAISDCNPGLRIAVKLPRLTDDKLR